MDIRRPMVVTVLAFALPACGPSVPKVAPADGPGLLESLHRELRDAGPDAMRVQEAGVTR